MLPLATQLSEEQIRSLIEGAFAPLHCAVHFNTYNGVVEFSITGTNNEQIIPRRPLLTITLAKNESFLKSTLSSVRQQLEEMDHSLLPWPSSRS